jgi:hypothetical protein
VFVCVCACVCVCVCVSNSLTTRSMSVCSQPGCYCNGIDLTACPAGYCCGTSGKMLANSTADIALCHLSFVSPSLMRTGSIYSSSPQASRLSFLAHFARMRVLTVRASYGRALCSVPTIITVPRAPNLQYRARQERALLVRRPLMTVAARRHGALQASIARPPVSCAWHVQLAATALRGAPCS